MQDPSAPPEENPATPEQSTDVVGDFATTLSDQAWLPEWAKPAWSLIEAYPILGSIVIVLVGFVVSRLIVSAAAAFVGQLTKRTQTDFDDQVVEAVRRPVFALVFYIFLGLAVVALRISPAATGIILKVLASLATLVWIQAGFRIGQLVLTTISRWSDRLPLIESRTLPLFDIMTKLLVLAIGTYVLLQIWNIDATAWLASAGVLGIAVGFAAKDTLANLFSGVFIVADAPYKLGDYVILDSGERGMVTHVGLRSTRILTRDDVEITIPNSVMGGAKIINESGGRWTRMRVRIQVGVAYGSDVDQVVAVLMQVAADQTELCKDPEPRVRMRGFGDSSLNFELLAWIDQPVDRGRISHELYMAVYKQLAAEKIEIPFPQRDLHIKQMPAGS